MKILIIANGYPNKHDPQWGCFEKDQAVALKNLGHDVCILYIDKRFRRYWRKTGVKHFTENGISVFGIFWFPMLGLKNIAPKFHFRLVTLMMGKVFKNVLKHWGKPDVIYAHYMYNIAFATKLKEKYNIPLVGMEHWSELTKSNLSPLLRYWGEAAYTKADKLLAVSESLQSHIYRHFGKESTVVYDMLGQEFVSADVKKRDINQPFRFIAVGSLLPIKSFDLLIKAYARSKLSNAGCTLSIIGGGAEFKNLENIITSQNLLGKVFLLGRKTKHDIIEMLSNCHVYVLSSHAETFGVACIEALSQGLPAIATKCGGPEEFINADNGILVPTEDVNALSEAMVNMYNNYETYDSVAIAEECKRRFAPQVIAEQLTRIFEEVVNNQNKI